MNMKWFIIGIIAIICGVVVGVVYSKYSDVTYSGKIVFNTEQEYSAFKDAVGNSKVSYSSDDMSVLSSSPPIVVQFKVSVPAGYKFDYGKEQSQIKILVGISIFVGVILIGYLVVETKEMFK